MKYNEKTERFAAQLDAILSEFDLSEQERVIRYALDHIVPRLRKASPAPVPDEQAGEWQWVPKEPTREMVSAGARCASSNMVYREMLAAAPSRPVAAEKREPLPEGWTIELKGEAIIVWRDDLGGYAATADDKNIASSILYHLAKELLGGTNTSTGGEA